MQTSSQMNLLALLDLELLEFVHMDFFLSWTCFWASVEV